MEFLLLSTGWISQLCPWDHSLLWSGPRRRPLINPPLAKPTNESLICLSALVASSYNTKAIHPGNDALTSNSIVYDNGKDYSGAKFFYTEPISLNKAHSTK